jgi:hypothetical protein
VSANDVSGRGALFGVVSADSFGGYGASTFGVDVPVPTNPIVLVRDSALFLHAGGVPHIGTSVPTHSQTRVHFDILSLLYCLRIYLTSTLLYLIGVYLLLALEHHDTVLLSCT